MNQLSDRIWQANEVEARGLCEGSHEGWIEKGVRAVLCPAYNVRIPYHPKLAALLLPVWDDSEPPPEMYEAAVKFHVAFGPTLVHCHGGLNRSSAFAAALLIHEGHTVQAALTKVTKRPWDGLVKSLEKWARGRNE